MKKVLRAVLIVVLIIFLVGVGKLSYSLVSSRISGESRKKSDTTTFVVTEKETETEMVTEAPRKEIEFVEDDTEALRHIEYIYDIENYEEEKNNFIDDSERDFYDNLMSEIEMYASTIYQSLQDVPREEAETYEYSVDHGDNILDIEEKKSEGYRYFKVEEWYSTIVGFFGDNMVVYAYNYDNNGLRDLVVVDYSNAGFTSAMDDVWRLGDNKALFIDSEASKTMVIEDVNVTFTRAVG